MNRAITSFIAFTILFLAWSAYAQTDPENLQQSPDSQVFQLITQPDSESFTSSKRMLESEKLPEYVNRTSPSRLNLDILTPDTPLQTGDLLLLDFFPDTTYIVEITSIRVNSLGVLTIRGIDSVQELETFTLSAHKGRAQADFLDLQNHRLYRISFDTDIQGHMVVDYDTDKLPKAQGMPPLRPE